MEKLKNHDLVPDFQPRTIRYEERPVKGKDGEPIDGLHQVWITLDNESQLNSYTTEMVRETILAFRKASADRRAVAVVFTGAGKKSFCTGGNTEEYATYYSGRPLEYQQYLRLFMDMVTGILLCDKPVICRVNGLRVAGGQEIGMACDFTIAADHSRFGQAGPVHGSAPVGGSTDFLDLYVGYAKAAESLILCEQWSAFKALRLGLINEVALVHRAPDGAFVPFPLAVTDTYIDAAGRIAYGEWKTGDKEKAAQVELARLSIDLAPLDAACDALVTRLLYKFPDCTRVTIENLRKRKLGNWLANCESNRSWLALNMTCEAAAGFPAFHFGDKKAREIDFVTLRRRLAEGAHFDAALLGEVLPAAARQKMEAGR